MTEKHKERAYNAMVTLGLLIIGAIYTASLTSAAANKKDVTEQLRKKADIVYVDVQNTKQDEALIIRFFERDKINTIILGNQDRIEKKLDKLIMSKRQ